MKPLVSIIIPAFNAEKYIANAINSVKQQSYDNWEAIIVNDGSTDATYDLAYKHTCNDERFSIYSKPNGGLSDARNYGLDRCKGEIISFLDSDDEMQTDFLSVMVKAFDNPKVNICGCGISYNEFSASVKLVDIPVKVFQQSEVIDIYLQEAKECEEGVCNKLFRKNVFENLRFRKGKIHEDTFIMIDVLRRTQLYTYFDFKGYRVNLIQGSITRRDYSSKEFDKVEACRYVWEQLKNTPHEGLAFNKYLGAIIWYILKTNGRYDNNIAFKWLGELPIQKLLKSKIKFYPFIAAFKLKFLKYLKV